MKKLPKVALTGLLVCALAACDGGSTPAGPEARPEPSERSVPGGVSKAPRAARAPRIPPRPKVYFRKLGGSRPKVEQAIADLKRVRMWKPLTSHLFRIEVTVEPGAGAVPEDGHLADARFGKSPIGSGTFEYPVGSYCVVRFFPSAMLADLARWNSYYSRGLTPLVPPSERQFWAAIVGHELSHCPRRGTKPSPEPVALSWERRVQSALAAAGIE